MSEVTTDMLKEYIQLKVQELSRHMNSELKDGKLYAYYDILKFISN